MIKCVCVVGAENNPLFFSAVGSAADEDPVSLQQICHCSLDHFDQRASALGAQQPPTDPLLGVLLYTHGSEAHGYLTPTQLKIVAVLDSAAAWNLPADALRPLFEAVHAAVVDAQSDPFTSPGEPIRSRAFEAALERAVASVGAPDASAR
ncbi:unnamed protein product [Pedinophyceae sp. YPF-701]|nr:unnamed protein product [Pedinophyceae sp. YPF-701]